jgi:hypothetical protein
MNRRNFFKRISMCAAAVAVAPAVIEALGSQPAPLAFLEMPPIPEEALDAVIGQYSDYNFAWRENMPPELLETSRNLAAAYDRELTRVLNNSLFDLSPPHQGDSLLAHRISPA